MTHRYIKIGITAFVLVGAFVGLLWTTLQDGTEYYKHVDEVMTAPAQWENKPMQLHGFVVPKSIYRRGDFDYIFQVQNNGSVVNATYTGVAPDTFFKEGAEVVLRGRLTTAGFHTDPDGIMAKCPSKYEATTAAKKVG
jgi:cytochrome c-type biogenesis protein CcmE